MITNERERIKKLALRRIWKAMQPVTEIVMTVPHFVISKFNFSAQDYSELIDRYINKITSPRILHGISPENRLSLIYSKAL